LAGHRRAFELLVLGEAFDADCGRSIGLINEVTGVGQVLARARDRAGALAALPQQALRKSKQMLRAHQQDLLQQVLVEEIDAFRERLNSAEAQGALMAFMQRG
jgi:enoyl-CoA hydratase/carnithine racemase